MSQKISINQVEKITGVSKRNIRFYEKEGLLLPKRDNGNGYRVYDEKDIWRVKVINMLRMVDMPLEEIQKVLEEDKSLGEALAVQQIKLERKAKEVQAAVDFCKKLKGTELEALDVDSCLSNIESTGGDGFFKDWIEDYKRIVEENLDMDFTFIPDNAITNEREFTEALFAYANSVNINLVVTKESMYPEFTINGIEYIAERNYSSMSTIPVAVVSCHRKDRGIKGEGVKEARKNLQWFLHSWGVAIVLIIGYTLLELPFVIREGVTWESVLILVGLLLLYGSLSYRQKFLHFNDKTKL